MIWIILSLLIILGIYYYLIRPHNYWKEMGVKQGKQEFILGDYTGFVLQKHSFNDLMKYVYDKFPNERYCGMYEVLAPTLVLRDPQLINDIMIKHFDHFVDRELLFPEKYEPLWSKNLLNLKGEKWREMRATLSPAFTSSKIKGMFNLMTNCAHQFTNHFSKTGGIVNVDLKDCFTRLTNDIIASCAFGVECNSLEDRDNEFYRMGKQLADPAGFWNKLRIMSFLVFPTLPTLLGITLFKKESTSFFSDIVTETMKLRKARNIYRPDMIHLLMEAREGKLKDEKEDGVGTTEDIKSDKHKKAKKDITDIEIVAQALLFFFGGFDSVANALIFTAYELAVNPDIQKRLWEEISQTENYKEGKVSYTELNQLKYMDCVVTEMLRKYPAFGGIDRKCRKSFTIEPVKDYETPLVIKPGDKVMIPIYGLQHDPKYFKDPEKFNPDRFSDKNKNNLVPYTYLAFGSGPRNCIGSRFSILEIKTVLFYLLLKFELVVSKNTPIPLKMLKGGFNTTVSGKLCVDFVPRR